MESHLPIGQRTYTAHVVMGKVSSKGIGAPSKHSLDTAFVQLQLGMRCLAACCMYTKEEAGL